MFEYQCASCGKVMTGYESSPNGDTCMECFEKEVEEVEEA